MPTLTPINSGTHATLPLRPPYLTPPQLPRHTMTPKIFLKNRSQTSKAAVSAISIFMICSAANAATVQWAAGQWSHPSQPLADAGYKDGETSGTSDLGDSITVNVAHAFTGGAISATGNLTVSNVVSGGVTPNSLRLQQSDDQSSPAVTMNRFSTLTLNFNTLVSTSGFTIFDVDRQTGSWADFTIVRAFSGIDSKTVTYTTSATYNATGSEFGLAGVRGLSLAANNSAQGNVGISVDGYFDRLEIIFTRRSGAGSASHGIGVSNIDVIPEPSSLAIVALGLGALLRRSRRKSA